MGRSTYVAIASINAGMRLRDGLWLAGGGVDDRGGGRGEGAAAGIRGMMRIVIKNDGFRI